MMEQEKTKLVQSEIDERTSFAKKAYLVGKIYASLIGSLACLGMLTTLDTPLKSTNDRLQALAGILWLGWSFLKTSSIKSNMENRLMLHSLIANEKTNLDPEQTLAVIKNAQIVGIAGGVGNLAVVAAVVAHGLGHMSSGMACLSGTAICLASEFFAKNTHKNNNLFLKAQMPKGVSLPDLTKRREKE